MPIYYNKNRDNVGSQCEKSQIIKNTDELIEIAGYQSFRIDNKQTITTNNGKMNTQLSILRKVDYSDCTSITDLGCSNGFFGLWYALNTPVKKIHFLDHDTECTQNLSLILNRIGLTECEIIPKNFQDGMQMKVKSDVVLMLSLIHWLYSCTTETGCLFEIIKLVRENTQKMLIIEWIDVSDYAMKSFNHTKFNKDCQKSEYNLKNFEEALNMHFNKVSKLGQTNTSTRVIYIAHV
jgi:hypothetical protein